jgi:hypothetical protein
MQKICVFPLHFVGLKKITFDDPNTHFDQTHFLGIIPNLDYIERHGVTFLHNYSEQKAG